jgi:TolA-binding protein
VSAHIGARTGDGGQNPGNHLWWQGQYYSRTGRDKRFPNFYERTGYGTGEGLSGWNCRHSFGSGTGEDKDNPFKDIQTEDNHRVEQLEKRQRELERRIRKTKREVMAMQEAVELCTDDQLKFDLQQELDRKSYLLGKQNEAYNDFCKANDLRTQPERLQIAKWRREQAAKSIAATKRYEAAKGV